MFAPLERVSYISRYLIAPGWLMSRSAWMTVMTTTTATTPCAVAVDMNAVVVVVIVCVVECYL